MNQSPRPAVTPSLIADVLAGADLRTRGRGCCLLSLLPLLCWICTGCFAYRPVPNGSLPVGSTVRAYLTSSGSVRIGELTGERLSSIDGTLVRAGRNAVTLEVWRADLGNGQAFDPGRHQLVLRRAYIVGLEEKRISYWKTGGLMATIGGGLYLLYEAFWNTARGGSGSAPPPGNPHATVTGRGHSPAYTPSYRWRILP